MAFRAAVLLCFVFLSFSCTSQKLLNADDHDDSPSYVLGTPKEMIKTEAGDFRVLKLPDCASDSGAANIGLGFLSLEPKALFLPHYTDADCLFVVVRGRGKFSWLNTKDELRNIELKEGDVYKIERGTLFQFFNTDEGQRFHVFSIHDIAPESDHLMFHNFFIAGGMDPETVFSGFGLDVLATAFNASSDEVSDVLLTSQTRGGIVYSVGMNESSLNMVSRHQKMFFRDMFIESISLPSIFNKEKSKRPFNILSKSPDFRNEYGCASAAAGHEYHSLRDLDKGIFSVKLKAGAVLAPHWNPRATEIALVTRGQGEIQIVHPNGKVAIETVSEGMVFYVPRNFPMCHIASRSGPFEFIGFSTSSMPIRPQFLAGSNSVLLKLDLDVLASSFNVPVQHVRDFLQRQKKAVILPGQPVEPKA